MTNIMEIMYITDIKDITVLLSSWHSIYSMSWAMSHVNAHMHRLSLWCANGRRITQNAHKWKICQLAARDLHAVH
jgi:hypothetical protein